MTDTNPTSPPFYLAAAPPIGVHAWAEVHKRLLHHGFRSEPIDLFDDHHAGILTDSGSAGLVRAFAARCEGGVLVAHGQAVPLALHVAATTSLAGLVLCNGPLNALDPVARTLASVARAAGPLLRTAARPALANTALASSLALRRLVVNPYVMDRDMVVRVTQSWTADRARRRAVVRWLRDLPKLVASAPPPQGNTLLVWGDEDVLYPPHVADLATGAHPGVTHFRVPGGRHLHPIERPWELADAMAQHFSPPTP